MWKTLIYFLFSSEIIFFSRIICFGQCLCFWRNNWRRSKIWGLLRSIQQPRWGPNLYSYWSSSSRHRTRNSRYQSKNNQKVKILPMLTVNHLCYVMLNSLGSHFEQRIQFLNNIAIYLFWPCNMFIETWSFPKQSGQA